MRGQSDGTEQGPEPVVTEVYVGEYSVSDSPLAVTCADAELRVADGSRGSGEATIPIRDVDEMVLDRSDGLTGFRTVSVLLAGAAVLFSLLSIPFALEGLVFHPVAFGVYLSAGLSWYGAADFYRLDGDTLDVLEVYVGNDRIDFLSDRGETDRLAAALHRRKSRTAGDPAESGRGGRVTYNW